MKKIKKIKKLKPYQDCDYKVVSTKLIDIKVEEQHYNLDQEYGNDDSIIKYEFNLIELPFFTKDKKVGIGVSKKYIFSERDNSYVEVTPGAHPKYLSNKILQEFDEKIFNNGIMRLSKNQNNSKRVITDFYTLMAKAGIGHRGNEYNRTKDSVERMKHCSIAINHVFYDAKAGKGRLTKTINLLQDFQIFTFEKYLELPEESRKEYEPYFRNSKIKEILILTLNDDIYENITNKGYLNFDADTLLKINNAVSRKLYIMLMKWQGWEKKFTIIRSCRFIASRIPLSYESNRVSDTIKILERACANLKELGLIKNFRFLKTKPMANTQIEIEFFTIHDHDLLGNQKEKRICASNQELAVETGHEILQITHQEDFIELTEVVEIPDQKLYTRLQGFGFSSNQAATLLHEYNDERLTVNLDYVERQVKQGKVTDIPAYTAKAIKGNWQTQMTFFDEEKEQVRQQETKQKAKQKAHLNKLKKKTDDEESHHRENLKLDKIIQALPPEKQAEIQAEAERRVIEKNGGKAPSIGFKTTVKLEMRTICSESPIF